ncbi:Thymidine kinase [Emticicia oligotrophica DSM 17448]|uniref:Thymidine kinase n=1 Tax=Emticicia oligotrophica (strain DSM 17448 / CIP 109782 / MTCC 6937 / GPTSA100-15) TaxID=929562 RepID=A0ABN4AQV8_EMTOG|nr:MULTISPECIES: thymidine kinase [Emticicia]AFK03557.1 Thymidine kinase [Emticicia oligotrophica DSM 17448]
MFIEPKRGRNQEQKSGWIEVVCGSMFSGKTEELIRRLKRAKIAKQKVEIFKPSIDVRYHEVDIVSHNQTAIRSTPVHTSEEILLMTTDCEVVGIDEAQFFDNGIIAVVNKLAENGKRVIVAGLDMDSRGIPFGPMPALMSIAEYVTKVHAICVVCGDIANYSYRKVPNEQQVMLGESDSYEARCRKCFHAG